VAPAKSGSPVLKILLVVVLLGGAVVMMAAVGAYFFGRKKIAEWRQQQGMTSTAVSGSGSEAVGERHGTPTGDIGFAFLTKEEMGAILGVPVTSIEFSSKSDANYKTANPLVEATVEIERKSDEADAIQDMEASRQVTRHAFGGKADRVPGLGDDAVYGAINFLYVRKGDVVMTITPPTVQAAAQAEKLSHVYDQPMGSDAQKKAMDEFSQSMKGDPNVAAMGKPDAVSGAVGLITHSATEQGNEYEKKARLMARQIAEKVLSKLGS